MVALRHASSGLLAFLAVLVAATVARGEAVAVAALRLSSSGPLFIAQDRGHFAAEGLEVSFKFFTAAQPVAVAVTTGDAVVSILRIRLLLRSAT